MPVSTTNKLKVTELDFDLIKNSLKDYLKGQGQFTDYDFEGSGLSILLDILSYNTHYNAFYTNMIANEMFLDSATLRDSVISLAKQLGYTPRSTVGAKAIVNISFTPNDLGGVDNGIATGPERLGTTVVIPKGSVFLSELQNKTYGFVTTQSYTATPVVDPDSTSTYLTEVDGDTVVPYTVNGMEITQGVYTSIQYIYNSRISNQQFIIPNLNADTTTITVLITDTLSGTSGTVYTLAKDYVSLTSDSTVFFLQEIADEKYEIYFGDGNIGAKPEDGNVIDITYVVSEGDAGNDATIFSSDPIKSPFYGVGSSTRTYVPTVTMVQKAAGGSLKEDIESIKFLAPRNYEAQNRAVTTDDYAVRLLTDYPQLDAVRCWGGEENDPPYYGKVFISIKPAEGYVLSDAEKENIKTNILKSRNVLTIEPILVDPTYVHLVVTTNVKWDNRLTPLTEATLKAGIRNAIIEWGQNNLEKFETYFRYSVLLKTIDNFDSGIVNNETTIKLRAEIVPILSAQGSYSITFGNSLFHPHTDHQGTLTSTTFNYAGYVACVLKDENGMISIYGSSPSTGQNTLIASDIGTINYDTGKISLTGFTPTSVDNGGVLSIVVIPLNQDIVPDNNQLFTIKDSDLIVTMFDDASLLSGTIGITRAFNQRSGGPGITGGGTY